MRRRKRIWIDLERFVKMKPEAKAQLTRGARIQIPSERGIRLVEVVMLTKTHTWVKPIDTRQLT